MVSSPATRPGTRKLSEVARVVSKPSGIVATGWPDVQKTCSKMGIAFDEWQNGAGRLILAKRADGTLATTVGGVGMSLPRQVGKTYLIAGMSFALCINSPGLLVIWSAHHARTHGETFLAMQAFADRSKVKPYVKQVFTGSGTEEIRFHNGSRILFGARERGFGRGIPGVDVLMFDEAQILSDKALEGMLATMNTSRFGLHMYVGTPPRPEDNSEAFTGMRRDALKGELEDGAWIECGADPGADPNDRKQWAKANPSYPHRTPVQAFLRLKKKLKEEGFLREGLGIWDEETDGGFFTPGKWIVGKDPDSKIVSGLALAVAVSLDRRRACIAASGLNEAGKHHLEPVWHGSVAEVPGEARRLAVAHGSHAFAIDGGGPGADLVPKLDGTHEDYPDAVPGFIEMSLDDVKVASSEMYDIVENGEHAHLDDPDLNRAVRSAVPRPVGDRFVIGRRKSAGDVIELEAATFATWAASRAPDYDPLDSIL